jgi:hypothetical protein
MLIFLLGVIVIWEQLVCNERRALESIRLWLSLWKESRLRKLWGEIDIFEVDLGYLACKVLITRVEADGELLIGREFVQSKPLELERTPLSTNT